MKNNIDVVVVTLYGSGKILEHEGAV